MNWSPYAYDLDEQLSRQTSVARRSSLDSMGTLIMVRNVSVSITDLVQLDSRRVLTVSTSAGRSAGPTLRVYSVNAAITITNRRLEEDQHRYQSIMHNSRTKQYLHTIVCYANYIAIRHWLTPPLGKL
jgi:hypothetical protein